MNQCLSKAPILRLLQEDGLESQNRRYTQMILFDLRG